MHSKDETIPLSPRGLFEFDLAGYTILRNFISAQQVEMLNTAIDRQLEGKKPRKFPFLHLGAGFLDLMSDARVMSICRYLLGPGFRLDTTWGIQFPPAQPGKPVGAEDLHAGPYANQGVFRYHWFDNRPRCGMIVFVYFLEAVEEDDGGLVLVPGSHKLNLGIRAQEVYRNLLKRRLDAWWLHSPAMQVGDALLFNEAVIHGTRSWRRTDRGRRNLHYGYSPAYQAQRDYEQLKKYASLARNETERKLMRGPYAHRFNDDGIELGENEWRSAVE